MLFFNKNLTFACEMRTQNLHIQAISSDSNYRLEVKFPSKPTGCFVKIYKK